MDLFISDTKSCVNSLIEIESSRLMYLDYEIITVSEIDYLPYQMRKIRGNNTVGLDYDVKVIIGIPPATSYAESYLGDFQRLQYEHKIFLDKSLLFEVLNIAKKVDIKLPFKEDSIQDSDILNLVKKYGFDCHISDNKTPFESMLSEFDRNKIFKRKEFQEFGFVDGIVIKEFKKQVYELKQRFSIYYAIVNEDKNLLYSTLKETICFAEKYLVTNSVNRTVNEENIIDFAKDYLVNTLQNYSFNIVLCHDKKTGLFKFKYTADNLFDACNLFLSQIITMDLNYAKSNIKYCANPECGRIFEGHKNRKYCDLCDRRTIWSRKNKKAKED